jgi:hypothetical protein
MNHERRSILQRLFLAPLLSNHATRTLVFPDTEKHRLTQSIIARPLCEFDLANHCRLDREARFLSTILGALAIVVDVSGWRISRFS